MSMEKKPKLMVQEPSNLSGLVAGLDPLDSPFRRQPKPVQIHILGGDQEDRTNMLHTILSRLRKEWGSFGWEHKKDGTEVIHWYPNAVND